MIVEGDYAQVGQRFSEDGRNRVRQVIHDPDVNRRIVKVIFNATARKLPASE